MSKHYLTGTHVTDTYVAFFGEESIFSNFHFCKRGVEYLGDTYPSSEHAYVSAKALYFGDMTTHTKVMGASTALHPAEIKKLGRVIGGFDKESWDNVKYGIMKDILISKFTRDQDLQDELLSLSRSRLFVEANPFDSEWGCGLSLGSADLGTPSKHKGRNLLGRLLNSVALSLYIKRKEQEGRQEESLAIFRRDYPIYALDNIITS
ncbi:hypothetical protein HOU41_gp091 [Proteus phage Stubb]|uniref:NADAR domain-containing protein n=1 Tax=Proteus phage Stubb TaxID=2315597 RepID=A0A3B8DJ69_9CAUD|nr:hypothetical protein HOU41_gp091 [Proteus phage Stubb]AYJ73253.1 hypothetical protein CPT_Stubb_137 [Proteus phage Stubb]